MSMLTGISKGIKNSGRDLMNWNSEKSNHNQGTSINSWQFKFSYFLEVRLKANLVHNFKNSMAIRLWSLLGLSIHQQWQRMGRDWRKRDGVCVASRMGNWCDPAGGRQTRKSRIRSKQQQQRLCDKTDCTLKQHYPLSNCDFLIDLEFQSQL